ncbi:PQQ-dependent sugar dehydrogenase [Azohydromonas aeria]|uniref:PQQ-dependent sugar dehydrogenase n=1 Tax=Azohydromonas aeria TaxID=2590212 RepID=UPI001E54D2B8|nr:sorbosone dehydrogenase family protein [Azohydromonas aeria]
MTLRPALLAATVTAVLAACGSDTPRLVAADMTGPDPTLPPPRKTLIPTVDIAPAVGWPSGAAPTPAPGLQVKAFATGLEHPRWLHVLPNGDVLVAETNAPPKSEGNKGFRGWVMKKVMDKAGAGVPSPNRISLLRDADGDGVAETKTVFAQGLNSPFGMALVGNELYVANTDAVVRLPYRPGDTQAAGAPQTLTDLPGGPLNHHWTKSLIASPDGQRLYATVGSNSNVAENGLQAEEGRAAIWEIDRATGRKRLFATGIRNPNGMAWEPTTGLLWTVSNERDEIGNDLVPDYLTSVRDGAFYGWPWSYWGQNVDARVKPVNEQAVAKALKPDYALGAHVAALGLAWSGEQAAALPASLRSGMFIGQHGSWNRKPLSGYSVVYVPFSNGRPAGAPQTVLSGFVNGKGDAQGRPVGVALDGRGALLVADDVGNTVWRVTAAQ